MLAVEQEKQYSVVFLLAQNVGKYIEEGFGKRGKMISVQC